MSESQISGGLLSKLSELLGTTQPALKLLLTVVAGYPIALLYRKFLYGKPASVQHIFLFLCGLSLGFWNYGLEIFHSVFAVVLTYLVLLSVGGSALSVGIILVFNLSYLLVGYFYTTTDNYDINWTMPHCILVLRLIGIAYDLYDGHQDLTKLSAENKKVALQKCPSLLEFLGHTMFPSGFLVGPQFPMKRYQNFIDGKFSENSDPPDSVKAAIFRLLQGVFYLSVFQILGFLVWDDLMISEEFTQYGFFKRMILMGVWGRYTLYKYISCWLLTEGACILFGLTYNGTDESGTKLWNGVENVKLSVFENTTEFNDYILSFNINTNHWVAQYIYKRLKFLGNRHISQLSALVFLAIWHGLHSGYYVCFFFEFIVVYMERDIKSIVNGNETLSTFFENPKVALARNILLRLYTFIFMGWCLMPFALLRFDRYWRAFSAVNHCGTIFFVLWPFIYSPIARAIFKKTKKKDTD